MIGALYAILNANAMAIDLANRKAKFAQEEQFDRIQFQLQQMAQQNRSAITAVRPMNFGKCASCGSREFVTRQGRTVCAFCRSTS
jgi:hypothetical protein